MQSLMSEAEQFYKNGNYAEAGNLYQEVVKNEPNNDLAHQGLAQCFNKLMKYKEAIEEARRALELNPTLAIPNLIVAAFEFDQGNYEQSEIETRKALDSDPTIVAAYLLLAWLEDKKGNTQEGLILIKRAIQLDSKYAAAYVTLGRLEEKLGHVKESLAALQQAILLNPNDSSTYYQLYLMSSRQGSKYQAIKYLWIALKLRPSINLIIRLIQALDRALYPLILILGVVIIVEPVDFAAKYVLPLMILLIIEQISVTAFDIIQWKNLKRNWKYVALRLFFVLLIIAGWDIDKYIYKH